MARDLQSEQPASKRGGYWLDRYALLVNGVSCLIFLLIPFFRLMSADGNSFPGSLSLHLSAALGVCLAVVLLVSLQVRINNVPVRRYLSLAALMIAILITLRFIESCALPAASTDFTRMLWYSHWLCFLLVAFFVLMAALQNNQAAANKRLDLRWWLLLIPTIALAILFLTNDMHQWAYAFPQGMAAWQVARVRMPLCYAGAIYIALFFLASTVAFFRSCRSSQAARRILPSLAWLLVFVLYLLPDPLSGTQMAPFYDLVKPIELGCFATGMAMENLILLGIIPSNVGYRLLLGNTSVPSFTVGLDGEQVISTQHPVLDDITPEMQERAIAQGYCYLTPNLLLRSFPITGGQSFFVEDLTAVNQGNWRLGDLQEQLSDETSLLQASLNLQRQLAQTKEQAHIYENLTRLMEPQFNRMELLLNEFPVGSPQSRRNMALACVVGAYTKRRVNLGLLAYDNDLVNAAELEFSLNESIEYLRLCGILCQFSSTVQAEPIDGQLLTLAYDFFEETVECALPTASTIMTDLFIDDDVLLLKLVIEDGKTNLDPQWRAQDIQAVHGELSLISEDGSFFARLSLPLKGGDDR